MNPPQPTEANKSKLPELLPCPFCGHKPTEDSWDEYGKTWFRVRCANLLCVLSTANGFTSQEVARELWNTRPAVKLPEKPSELVATLAANLNWFDAVTELYDGKVAEAFCFFGVNPNRLPEGVLAELKGTYRTSSTFSTWLRAVQAALEKEGL